MQWDGRVIAFIWGFFPEGGGWGGRDSAQLFARTFIKWAQPAWPKIDKGVSSLTDSSADINNSFRSIPAAEYKQWKLIYRDLLLLSKACSTNILVSNQAVFYKNSKASSFFFTQKSVFVSLHSRFLCRNEKIIPKMRDPKISWSRINFRIYFSFDWHLTFWWWMFNFSINEKWKVSMSCM